MLKGRDIVVIGLQPWYTEIGSNCKNIAAHLAQHNRVLYVNLPINRKTFLSKDPNPGVMEHIQIIKEKRECIKEIAPHFWQLYATSIIESINWLPSTALFKAVNFFNNKRLAKNIKQAVAELGFQNIILFNDNDFFNGYHLKNLVSPSLYIYYCRDYLRGTPYWKKHGDLLEPEVIKRADLALANSGYLADYCAEFNTDSHYIGQGCNIELFDPLLLHPVPDDLQMISSPVIGYVGAVIASRLDEKIIMTIAKANSKWNIVLVGPEDDTFKNSSLHQMPNVHFTGRKEIAQLPAYIQNFDVCINPQLVNMLTIGNYPLKVDEYLAMGKPVVATKTKTMEFFQAFTYLAEKPEDYPRLIEKALNENTEVLQQERIAFARTHTWNNCVDTMSKFITDKENSLKNSNAV